MRDAGSVAVGGRVLGLVRDPWLGAYLVLYGTVLAALRYFEAFGLALPLFVLVVMGGGFSLLAWAVTRSALPLPYAVRHPRREVVVLAASLVPLVAFLTWGLDALHAGIAREPWDTVAVTAAKLGAFVILPALAVGWSSRGAGPRPLPALRGCEAHVRPALLMGAAMLVFQMLVGRGLADVQKARLSASTLGLAAVGALLWACLEAGLVEEFYFRVLLQSRLAAWLRSETAAIVVMAVVFGLAHAPGFYLRTSRSLEALGAHPSPLMAVGYAIVVTSAVAFPFGVLWARTRNLCLLVVVHGLADWLQGIVPFADTWGLR